MIRLLLLIFILLLPSVTWAKDLAEVNNVPITEAQVLAMDPSAKNNHSNMLKALQVLINRQLLLTQAKREKISETSAFKTALTVQKENLLVSYVLASYFQRHPIRQKKIYSAYQELVKKAPDKEYRVREILVHDRSEAMKVIHDLRQGQRFSNLAAEYSVGPNAALGGELGWVSLGQLQVNLGMAIRGLSIGEVTGPLSLPEGWGIIQLLNVKAAKILPLDVVKMHLISDLQQKETEAYLEKLRKEAHIHIFLQ